MTQRNKVDKNISKDKEKSFDIMWKYEISGYRYSQKITICLNIHNWSTS